MRAKFSQRSRSEPGTSSSELIGVLCSERRAGGFALGHWYSPASAPRVEPHGHETAHFILVTSGEFRTEADGSSHGLPLIFNPAGTYHADHFDRQGSFLGITLDRAASALLGEIARPGSPVQIETPVAVGTANLLLRAACSGPGDFEKDVVEALCLELAGELEPARRHGRWPPKWLQRATEFLRDESGHHDISSVARCVGVHPVHLTRSFRAYFRCTPIEYRRLHKVRRAASLLAGSLLPIGQIAAECHFADQSHLVRSFRRQFGVTPLAFRAALA